MSDLLVKCSKENDMFILVLPAVLSRSGNHESSGSSSYIMERAGRNQNAVDYMNQSVIALDVVSDDFRKAI